jgi:hypothetical protein
MYVNGKVRPVKTISKMVREIKENDGGSVFKYDIFDILQELLQMLQCTLIQHNKKSKKDVHIHTKK